MKNEEIKRSVKKGYSNIAKQGCSCSCGCGNSPEKISREIGYSYQEMNNAPEANLGLGCGNPTALGKIKNGDVVLDLGSGAGFDAFLAARKVGEQGKVIGVDITPEMIKKAQSIAMKYGYSNVEFKLGDIESLPIENDCIDVVISNCVINLAPDKGQVFREAFRVLKNNGKMFVSDIVLLGELTKDQREDKDLLTGCVAGALQKEDYIQKIKNAGFQVKILGEDKDISKRQYQGISLESLKIEATKDYKKKVKE